MKYKTDTWTQEELVLLALARNEDAASILPLCSVETLSGLAARHKVCAPLAHAILGWKVIPPVMATWAKGTMLVAERDALLCGRSLRQAVSILETAGVFTVVLKGPSLSGGTPRDTGDIDLLIRESDLERAIAALKTARYRYVGTERNMRIRRSEHEQWSKLADWSNQFEFKDPETGGLVELHTGFFEKKRVYFENLSPLLDSVGDFIAGSGTDPATGFRFLAIEDRVLLLALHASLKRSPGNGSFILRHAIDLRKLVEFGFEWEVAIEKAARYRVLHHLYSFMLVCTAFVPGLIPESAENAATSRLTTSLIALAAMHAGCVGNLRNFSHVKTIAYKITARLVLPCSPLEKIKALLIVPIMLPPVWRLAEIYRVPNRFPFKGLLYLLEPFRWCALIGRKLRGYRHA